MRISWTGTFPGICLVENPILAAGQASQEVVRRRETHGEGGDLFEAPRARDRRLESLEMERRKGGGRAATWRRICSLSYSFLISYFEYNATCRGSAGLVDRRGRHERSLSPPDRLTKANADHRHAGGLAGNRFGGLRMGWSGSSTKIKHAKYG